MTAPLSPAAQAVLTAQAKERCLFEWSSVNDPPCHPNDPGWNGCVQCVDRRGIAAALRVAADQVVPEDGCSVYGLTSREAERQAVRREFLALATKLEAHQ